MPLDNPAKLPPANLIEEVREPIIRANILTPPDYVGNVITLCEEKRGSQIGITYLGSQVQISYELPMAEVVLDFFDRLKSVSRGYASLDYHFLRFQAGPFVRVDTLINGDKVDALQHHHPPRHADRRGREIWREDERTDPAADVRRRDPGRGRLADHRPQHGQGDAQERAGQVLRRRHLAARRSCSRSRRKARSG